MILKPGDQVPADARLVTARNLQADESALTGESVPAEKRPELVEEGTPVADRTSVVHGGTLVTHGTATAVVIATGNETELGRISSMLEEATQVETPLTRQIAVVSRWSTVAVAVIAVLILDAALLRGYPLVDAALAAIALAVAAIPEGLPTVITISRLARPRHAESGAIRSRMTDAPVSACL